MTEDKFWGQISDSSKQQKTNVTSTTMKREYKLQYEKNRMCYVVNRMFCILQVRYAQQEVELKRVKRNMIYDKQLELPIREIKDNSVYHRIKMPTISVRDYEDELTFNDPLFGDMWYLVST